MNDVSRHRSLLRRPGRPAASAAGPGSSRLLPQLYPNGTCVFDRPDLAGV